jgi:FkbM family methyltransferase
LWLKDKYQRPFPPLKFRNGFVWHHGPRDQPLLLFREIFIDHFYEPLEAPPNAVVLDIGANIGAVTLYWAVGRPDISFHAYEPNPESCATLRKNIEANRMLAQVTIYAEAISGTRGQLDLWVNVPTTLSTSYGDPPAEGARKVSVPAVTLDDAWERTGRSPIWMLKIDTEGAEGDILEAASDAMLGSVQTACIEWHDNIVPGVRARCLARLRAAGFTYHERFHPWNEGIIFAKKI